MISGILITNFPIAYVRDKIVKKLSEYDIDILEISTPKRFNGSCVNKVDKIFIMHEMTSHSEILQCNSILKKNEAESKVIFLSRKASSWKKDLEKEIMAAPKAVRSSQINNLVKDFIELRKSGLTMQEIVPHVSKYWVEHRLASHAALYQYMKRIVITKRCDESMIDSLAESLAKNPYKEFIEEQSVAIETVNNDARIVSEEPVISQETIPEATQKEVVESPITTPKDDWQKLAEVFSEENIKLKQDVNYLQGQVSSLKKEIASLKEKEIPTNSLQLLLLRKGIDSLLNNLTDAAKASFEIKSVIEMNMKLCPIILRLNLMS